jgi:hypothetical protein
MTCSLAQTSLVRIYPRWATCGVFIGYRRIGPWLFTQLLLPALFAATDASPSHEKARIVTLSSAANYFTVGLDFDAFVDGPGRIKYDTNELYCKSKFVRRTEILPTVFNGRPGCRVTLLWRASLRGDTATRSCPPASIQEPFALILCGIGLGGSAL